MNLAQISAETLALAKAAIANPLNADESRIAKSITTGTGLVAYDLQAPAKNLYPVLTPLRNLIPRVGGGTGVATNWRQVSALLGSGYNAMPWVPEGQRSARMSYTTSTVAASYVTIGEEDQISFEAINAAKNFEDERAKMTMRLLQKTMIKEESAILCGNRSVALGTPTTPTLAAAGSGATLPAATYSVIVVALTAEGIQNSSLSGGVATSQVITGADGNTFTLSGGSSQKSTNATQAVTLGQTLSASTAAIPGAAAYAWYVGTAGSETLQSITTINSATFAAALAGGRQAATAITADNSKNANYAFDGLISAAIASGTAYVVAQATGTAGTGTPLTASGRGSVNEMDTMCKSMWDNYRLSPTVFYMNSQEILNITNKVLGNAGSPLVRFVMDQASNTPVMTAGAIVGFYFNPFTIDGGKVIPIRIHPNCPAGTILGYCEDLPAQYQSNEVPNVAEIKLRAEYQEFEWALRTRQREHGVYAEEVLAVYAPFAMGIIYNIGNG